MIDVEALWDYYDPEGSRTRFFEAKEGKGEEDVAELDTQIARTHSLLREFAEAHAILDKVSASSVFGVPKVKIRYLLERGRTHNSSREKDLARGLFLQAYELAVLNHEEFLAADAAHMMAIVEPGESSIDWNRKTIEIARVSTDLRARKWIGSAGNNLGWSYHSLGRFEEALAQFEEVERFRRELGGENHLIARWCVARTLRSLGRLDEALTEQLKLLTDRDALGKPSGFVFEEMGECLHGLHRGPEAAPYFARAFELLSEDKWISADEPERLERLRTLSELQE